MCILTYLTVYDVEVIWSTEIVRAQVALEGVDSSSHAVAVDAALAVLEGLETQTEVRGARTEALRPCCTSLVGQKGML